VPLKNWHSISTQGHFGLNLSATHLKMDLLHNLVCTKYFKRFILICNMPTFVFLPHGIKVKIIGIEFSTHARSCYEHCICGYWFQKKLLLNFKSCRFLLTLKRSQSLLLTWRNDQTNGKPQRMRWNWHWGFSILNLTYYQYKQYMSHS
jgi:hypothetical protein